MAFDATYPGLDDPSVFFTPGRDGGSAPYGNSAFAAAVASNIGHLPSDLHHLGDDQLLRDSLLDFDPVHLSNDFPTSAFESAMPADLASGRPTLATSPSRSEAQSLSSGSGGGHASSPPSSDSTLSRGDSPTSSDRSPSMEGSADASPAAPNPPGSTAAAASRSTRGATADPRSHRPPSFPPSGPMPGALLASRPFSALPPHEMTRGSSLAAFHHSMGGLPALEQQQQQHQVPPEVLQHPSLFASDPSIHLPQPQRAPFADSAALFSAHHRPGPTHASAAAAVPPRKPSPPKGTVPAASESKTESQASRRRRKRTARACLACHKAKSACDELRPCTRCKRLNKQCITRERQPYGTGSRNRTRKSVRADSPDHSSVAGSVSPLSVVSSDAPHVVPPLGAAVDGRVVSTIQRHQAVPRPQSAMSYYDLYQVENPRMRDPHSFLHHVRLDCPRARTRAYAKLLSMLFQDTPSLPEFWVRKAVIGHFINNFASSDSDFFDAVTPSVMTQVQASVGQAEYKTSSLFGGVKVEPDLPPASAGFGIVDDPSAPIDLPFAVIRKRYRYQNSQQPRGHLFFNQIQMLHDVNASACSVFNRTSSELVRLASSCHELYVPTDWPGILEPLLKFFAGELTGATSIVHVFRPGAEPLRTLLTLRGSHDHYGRPTFSLLCIVPLP